MFIFRMGNSRITRTIFRNVLDDSDDYFSKNRGGPEKGRFLLLLDLSLGAQTAVIFVSDFWWCARCWSLQVLKNGIHAL